MAGEYGHFEFGNEVLMPRYYLGDTQPTLARRQDSKCKSNQHQCVDIGFPGECCSNDEYCYVDPGSKKARCCALERNCDEDCGSTRYFCEQTVTTDGSTTVTPACCPRACTEQSFYRCEEDQGGACCPYDNACSGTVCVSTVTPTESPLVTPVDEGCTTSQSRCEDGHGCCDETRKCARVSGTDVCAPADFSAPGEVVDTGGLSDGAKAGIGVGVAVVASAITAGLTWLYLRRRTRKRARPQDASPGEENEEGDVEFTNTALTAGAHSVPEASEGPFSGEGAPQPNRSAAGVPAQPNAPDDIVPPVEIDSMGVTPVGGEPAREDGEPTREEGVLLYELPGSGVPELWSPPPPSGDLRDGNEAFEMESPVLGRDSVQEGNMAGLESAMLEEDSGGKGQGAGLESQVVGEGSPATEGAGDRETPVSPEGSRDSPIPPMGGLTGAREAHVVSPVLEEASKDKE